MHLSFSRGQGLGGGGGGCMSCDTAATIALTYVLFIFILNISKRVN